MPATSGDALHAALVAGGTTREIAARAGLSVMDAYRALHKLTCAGMATMQLGPCVAGIRWQTAVAPEKRAEPWVDVSAE